MPWCVAIISTHAAAAACQHALLDASFPQQVTTLNSFPACILHKHPPAVSHMRQGGGNCLRHVLRQWTSIGQATCDHRSTWEGFPLAGFRKTMKNTSDSSSMMYVFLYRARADTAKERLFEQDQPIYMRCSAARELCHRMQHCHSLQPQDPHVVV